MWWEYSVFYEYLKEIKCLSEKKEIIKKQKKRKEKEKGETSFLWINKCLNHVQSCCKYLNRKKWITWLKQKKDSKWSFI